ncbi:MAG TPA: MBOAT family protein [Bacteroidales bacterium]|jgi:alginate O-acetyltransferase complex protein AlgI|nr:MBOAT family protein [Bacteroidales bacterium]HPE43649.1 MBOAT family protein [Bacteroidales bacterium]
MVFSSSLFLLYFLPAFLILYFLVPRKIKNYVALLASIGFYAWGAPDFIFIVIGSILIDFYLVKWLFQSSGNKKRWITGISVMLNVGLLAYFKYANFFVENLDWFIQQLGGESVTWTRVALPIGISFFTFQKMTYAVDVHRGVHPPLKKVSDLALYILMFPQLIAGPIVRFNEIAEQLVDRRKNENTDNRLTGFFRFAVGLGRKVMIANPLGAYADSVFAADPTQLASITLWIGILAYAFQIYYDFAGYSDMAIGLGRMIGFDFPENFNNPYISQNISEFWRRWHMTLGRWMRDYLYIPLGGNRVTPLRMYFNLWLVFLISGLWHGAAWNFVVWGAFHGFFLVADRLFLLKFYKAIGKFPSVILTFIITLVGWVLFRAESMDQVWHYTAGMFSFRSGETLFVNQAVWMTMIFAAIFAILAYSPRLEQWQVKLYGKKQPFINLIFMSLAAIVLFIISLSAITSSGFNPFIYFRF